MTMPRRRAERGLKAIIAGAGGAAHLPGMTASMTVLPVLGVPVETRALKGLDSLLSIAQMPGGIPVATFAIGESGAKNAGLFAAALAGPGDPELRSSGWHAGGRARHAPFALASGGQTEEEKTVNVQPLSRATRSGIDDRHSRRRPIGAHAGSGSSPARVSDAHLFR